VQHHPRPGADDAALSGSAPRARGICAASPPPRRRRCCTNR
jgi:hypothetical protein